MDNKNEVMKIFMFIIYGLIILVIGVQVGIWKGRKLERDKKCEPSVICRKVNGGLRCNYIDINGIKWGENDRF